MVREEIGRSSSVAISQSDLPGIKTIINRVYETLYDEHDWPFLRRAFPRIPLQNGQRFYDLPSDLNVERIEDVSVWWGGSAHPLPRGINSQSYSSYDSVTDERTDPALAWDLRWSGDSTAGTPQVEIWPIPSTNDSELEITGIQKIQELNADEDQCLLDDKMVVLFVAAQFLARQKSEDADWVANQAASRFNQMAKRVSTAGSRRHRKGLGGHRNEYDASKLVLRVGR